MERILVYGMTDNPGGIETYLLNLLKNSDNKSIIFDFVTDFPDIAYKKEILSYGSKIYYIPAKGKNLFLHWKELWKILICNKNYRKVYFNVLDAGAVFTMFIPWIMRRKVIVHSHNGNTDKTKLHKICRPFLNLVCGKSIACSKIAAEYMFGETRANNALIIPNAIDVEKYKFDISQRNEIRKQLGIEKKYVICHIGRISMQKNPYFLLDIFKAVIEKEKNAVLLYIGSGELETDIHQYAENIGVLNNVQFLGVRKDIPQLLFASDVFLLPSLYEGFPIVGLEAQAASLPCVLSDEITDEINVTGDVKFCSLKSTVQVWADELLKCQNQKRNPSVEMLIKKGYGLKYRSKAYDELQKYFLS